MTLGEMVIKFGGVESGFKNVKDDGVQETDAGQLYHVKGTTAANTRAVQVLLLYHLFKLLLRAVRWLVRRPR